jgi:hypothetical protein
MNLNTHNLCDDWGWYVDTENDDLLINSNKIQPNTSYKKFNNYKFKYYKFNKLHPASEYNDEYDYYKNNYRDIEQLQLEYSSVKIENIEKKTSDLSLYNIGSTTLITSLLAYTIFFLI